jgi:hypothetical protein
VCGVYNDVLINLCIEKRANASDDADAHDCGVLVPVPAVSLAVCSPARRCCRICIRVVVVVVAAVV